MQYILTYLLFMSNFLLCVCLRYDHNMRMSRGVEVQLRVYLTSVGTRWQSAVSFTPQIISPWGKHPRRY